MLSIQSIFHSLKPIKSNFDLLQNNTLLIAFLFGIVAFIGNRFLAWRTRSNLLKKNYQSIATENVDKNTYHQPTFSSLDKESRVDVESVFKEKYLCITGNAGSGKTSLSIAITRKWFRGITKRTFVLKASDYVYEKGILESYKHVGMDLLFDENKLKLWEFKISLNWFISKKITTIIVDGLDEFENKITSDNFFQEFELFY